MKEKSVEILKNVMTLIIISLVGCAGIVFSILYVNTFNEGFFADYSGVIIALAVSVITVLTVLTIVFYKTNKAFIYKILYITIILIFCILLLLYVLKVSGFFDKIDSVEDFRNYIESFGNFAVFMFILLQFLQVVVLPIPAFITVGAGVLLFGPFRGALYSCIGIITGSVVAFFIGRVFGYKVASWLVGKEDLDKGLETVKGKDKVVLTFMFLFPFFPDDLLCIVAGITSMSSFYFIVMIFITRVISIYVSSYSMNNSIIPYDTWWGIVLWGVIFLVTAAITVFIYKKGDKIEAFFMDKFSKKTKKEKTKKQ